MEVLEDRRLLSVAAELPPASLTPGAPDLTSGTDSGVSDADNVTRFNNSTASLAPVFDVRGTVPGALITLYVDGQSAGSATATGAVTQVLLQPTNALADGVHTVVARQTEAEKAESADSPVLTLTVDTVAPPAAPAPDLLASSDSGSSAEDNVTNDNTPGFAITAGPFYRVTRDGIPASGLYATDPVFTSAAVADGLRTFAVRAVDAAGNESAPSPGLQVVIDTRRPGGVLKSPVAPVERDKATYDFVVTFTDDQGIDVGTLGDNGDIRVTGPKGFDVPATGVSVRPPGVSPMIVDATYRIPAPGGYWDYTDNGIYDFVLQAGAVQDLAGNSSIAGQSLSLGKLNVRLITPPAAPHLSAASDSGAVVGDDVTKLNGALLFSVGGVSNGAMVTIYADGVAAGSARASSGQIVVPLDPTRLLADGAYRFTARQEVAGQPPSDPSLASVIVIDTVAPDAPSSIDLLASSDSGVSDSDNLTNDTTPTFDVAVPADAPYARIFRDGDLVSGPYAPAHDATAVDAATDGTHSFTAIAMDLAGNWSPPTSALIVTIDTAPPGPATVAGTPDQTFDGDGIWYEAGEPQGVAVQSDGRIVLGRKTATGSGLALTRLNRDGSLDTSFGTAGRVELPIAPEGNAAIRVAPDGRIVVIHGRRIVRVSQAGIVDTSFGNGGVADVPLDFFGLDAAADGSIAVVGPTSGENQSLVGVVRLNPDGSPNPAFGGDGEVETAVSSTGNATPYAVEVLADGRVLVAGTALLNGGATYRIMLLRYRTDGSLDPTFGQGGLVLTRVMDRADVYSIAVQPDGKILLGGNASDGDPDWSTHGFALRYAAGGALDTGFGIAGLATVPGYAAGRVQVTLAPGGEILLAGEDKSFRLELSRLRADGTLDERFGGGGVTRVPMDAGQGLLVYDLATVPSDQAVVAGLSIRGNGTSQAFVARFDTVTAGTIGLADGSDSGVSATDNLTNDATPTFNVAPRAADGDAGPAYYRLYRDSVLASGGYETSDTVTLSAQPDGTRNYVPVMVDAAGNESARGPELSVTIDTTGPEADVVVSGSLWSPAFLAALEAANLGVGGFSVPTDPGSHRPVPWSNLDTVKVRLSEGVPVRKEDLQILGLELTPQELGFAYDPTTHIATWTLPHPLRSSRLVLRLSDAVADAAGNGATSVAGGSGETPFELGLSVLPGDVDRTAVVTARDLLQVRARWLASAETPGSGPRAYSPLYDINGDGRIQALDLATVRAAMFARLPAATATDFPASESIFGMTPIREGDASLALTDTLCA